MLILQIPKFFIIGWDDYLDWAQVIILVLQVMGMLGNPFVLLLYLMEQCEIYAFGGSARCSDLRIFLYFVVHVAFIVGSFYSK
jgi:hypothetical protein